MQYARPRRERCNGVLGRIWPVNLIINYNFSVFASAKVDKRFAFLQLLFTIFAMCAIYFFSKIDVEIGDEPHPQHIIFSF